MQTLKRAKENLRLSTKIKNKNDLTQAKKKLREIEELLELPLIAPSIDALEIKKTAFIFLSWGSKNSKKLISNDLLLNLVALLLSTIMPTKDTKETEKKD